MPCGQSARLVFDADGELYVVNHFRGRIVGITAPAARLAAPLRRQV